MPVEEQIKGPMCNSCAVFFQETGQQREHYKTEFHLYNTKRRVAGLEPISEELWNVRLEQIKSMTDASLAPKGSSHKKTSSKQSGKSSLPSSPSSASPPRSATSLPIIDETYCLFDGTKHETVSDNLEYMASKFSFFIPDIEHLTDLTGLLHFLAEKLVEGHQCLYCDRAFGSLQAVRGHMMDMRHTRIGTHTDDLLDDIEDFFTYPDEDTEQATIREDGSLQLPNGGVAISREFAYIYKQRVRSRPEGTRGKSIMDERQKYLAILGGNDSGGVANNLPTYRLKRMAKRVWRDQRRGTDMEIRTQMKRHRTAVMLDLAPQIVEMYSYGK